ncbi:non-lysosomal glucosylceramidase [Allokutzneria sp. A3M-2-11 16]|uniref:GH116 family glycosyl hydrolase n=1 Tax=Allokutzneria sp. A3M-2-11 16 TaxID=2962043 RepID=UPI0020B8720E|nr:GH116 family glycosyl hydrolase [Allokutzneria sp. A3M-2-11 16]MCP3803287.1 non-lysosomal glucosylceramidase [Allokutzneria sp. A3M-2-11 16]
MSTTPAPDQNQSTDCCPDTGCCAPEGQSRRTFLTLGLTGVGMLAAPEGAAAALGLDAAGLVSIPAEKNLTPESVRALLARGTPTEYRGEALQRIGMPVGGGCAGQVYLAGDGRLWAWDILNPASFPLGGASYDGPHYAHPLTARPRFPQGFTIRITAGGRTRTRTLDADGFADVRFIGQYPVGTVTYRAPDSPVEVVCRAFSPFVPMSVPDSTLPATVLSFTVRNTSGSEVRAELVGSSANPVCLTTRRQQPIQLRATPFVRPGLRGVEFSAAEAAARVNTDILFEDWQSATYEGWTVTGDAFGSGPVTPAELPKMMRRFGDLTISGRRFVTSYNFRAGGDPDGYQGTLTSRPFTVERRYVAVAVGGGNRPGEACVEVVVGGQVVASATGANSEPTVAVMLDVGAHKGKSAQIRIADRSSGPWGHVNCDAIVFTDNADILFEDWESGTYNGWTVTGNAFGGGPVTPAETPEGFRRPFGEITDLNVSGTRFVTSYNFRAGGDPDSYQGKLTSRSFTIERDYVTVWVGGGGHPGTCVNVLVDNEVVASFTGQEIEPLTGMSMDVSRWKDRTARIEIVDSVAGGWGHVNVDRIVFSDRPVRRRPIAELPEFGTFALAALDDAAVVNGGDGESATVTVPLTIQTGQSKSVRFALGWHFPTPQPTHFSLLQDGARLRHHYVTRFGSARVVLEHISGNRDRLIELTESWVRTWYTDSTLPHWFLERTMASASTFATNTCYRFDNGRFYAWEGIYCCVGTCGHVWNYAQTIARLFPELERDTRQRVDLGIALRPNGEIGNRGEAGEGWFADGQCGTILRVYREHQMSANDEFLRRVWPAVRSALEFVVRADGDLDGILEGSQWNTLDAQWFGEIPWISGLYVAALHAGAAMARELGDTASVTRYSRLAELGSRYLETSLWSDRYGYFFHRVDPAHPTSVNSNRGCYIDQMYGQTYAAQLALPRVFSPSKAKTALASVFRNNFLPDPASYRPPGIPIGRVYATPGEPGTLMCTWPYGGSTESGRDGPVGYFNEVWTGQEYQLAAHMFAEGMVPEALAVTRAVHDRYSAAKRNPYNEIECSDHYARAMMSYGTYLAACGYEHHGPQGHLGFAPKITPEDFRAAFTVAEGWGLYRQTRQNGKQTCVVELRYGRSRLRTLAFDAAGPVSAVSVNGSPAAFTVSGTRVMVTLAAPVTLTAGSTLEVVLSH